MSEVECQQADFSATGSKPLRLSGEGRLPTKLATHGLRMRRIKAARGFDGIRLKMTGDAR